MQAVSGQDENGWAHFIKGYMSCEWRLRQKELYHSIGSQHTAQSWTEVLLSNILTLMWLAAIDTQFHMDVKGLLPQDKYLITCNRQAMTCLLGQKTWLNSILITQEIYKSLIESETQQLCKQPYGGCTVGWIIGTYIIHICLPLPRVKALQDWKLFYTITFLEVFPCGE